ncbi:MAG: Pycsar system effector family protein [Smithellaceae bacterium]
MDNQEDVNKISSDQGKAIEEDIQKLAPLDLGKPSGANEGVQSFVQKPILNLLKEICPSIRDYVSGYISLADAKAGVLIGVFSGLLSLSIAKGNKILALPIQQWQIIDYLTFFDWMVFALGIMCSLFVVWPKTSTCKKRGFVSWVHIANYKDVDSYLKDILSAGESDISGQLCELNFDLSNVCKRKYFWLTWSFRLGFFGSVLLAVLLLKKYF